MTTTETKKLIYEMPELQIINFCISDVLTTSNDIDGSLPDGTWQ